MTKIINGLYGDPLLAQFYDSASENRVDFEFCLGLARQGQDVLDLGCGTGELATKLAANCQVTGVEPAAAMLDIARKRENGDLVQWVEADAIDVRLGKKFDLIILTGHSFQVFLNAETQLKVLKTIALHLKPDGKFIFDSRNPNFKAPKTRSEGNNIRILDHAEHGKIEMWNESNYDDHLNVLTYTNGFKVVSTGEEFSSSEQIYYAPQPEIERLIQKAGLYVSEWYGDWLGALYHERSREIIPYGGLA